MMDEAVIALQTKLAYQEDMIESLNQVVIRQQRQLEALEKRYQQLSEKVATLNESAEKGASEVPPHY